MYLKISILILILNLSKHLDIKELKITKAQFLKLQTLKDLEKDNFSASLLTPDFRKIFKDLEKKIYINPKDKTIGKHLPNEILKSGCVLQVEALNPEGIMKISDQSYVEGKIDFNWSSISIIGEMNINGTVDAGTDVRARLGIDLFGCHYYARKTAGVYLNNKGKGKLGIELKANKSALEKIDNKWYLVFNLNFNFFGVVMNFDLENIKIDGCDITIFGFKIASVCGYLEKKAKTAIQNTYNQITKISIPNLLNRIEESIQAKVDKQIKIPLSFLD